MLRLVIGGIICFLCAYLGIVGKKYYDKRLGYLKSCFDFILLLFDGISYSKDSLPQIAKRFLAGGKGAFYCNLAEYVELAQEGEVDEKSVSDCFDCKYINKSDRVFFKEFFVGLGKFDYDTQISKIELCKSQLSKMIEKAEKDCKTTGNLLSKLGLIVGIAVMIILA